MSLKILLAAGAALVALSAPAAWAQDPSQSVEVRREVIMKDDPHGQGHHCHAVMMRVGPEEATKAMHDHHGDITREEFIAAHTKLFDDLDLNHDGRLEPDEIEKAHSAMMSSRDGDCEKMMHDHHGEMDDDVRVEERRDDGDRHGDGDRHIQLRMIHGIQDFDKMDANHDGKISFEEFTAPLREAFDQLDKNHDGGIDRSEWEAGGHMEIRKEVHEDPK